jgi:hypothetical protein
MALLVDIGFIYVTSVHHIAPPVAGEKAAEAR